MWSAPYHSGCHRSGQSAGRPEFLGLRMKSSLRPVGKFKVSSPTVACGEPSEQGKATRC